MWRCSTIRAKSPATRSSGRWGRNKFAVKSKTLRAEGTELAVEVCCRDNASEVTDRLRSIEGVEDVTMIQYNGEYHG